MQFVQILVQIMAWKQLAMRMVSDQILPHSKLMVCTLVHPEEEILGCRVKLKSSELNSENSKIWSGSESQIEGPTRELEREGVVVVLCFKSKELCFLGGGISV